MTLAITYLGIINFASFGCLGIVCFVLLALNCKVRLERDQYKEEVEDYKSEVETYQAMIDEKNERIAELIKLGYHDAFISISTSLPHTVNVLAFSNSNKDWVLIRSFHASDPDDYLLALNLAEELADKINEQV